MGRVHGFCDMVHKLKIPLHRLTQEHSFFIRGLDHPLTFTQCLSYFDNFNLSGWFKK